MRQGFAIAMLSSTLLMFSKLKDAPDRVAERTEQARSRIEPDNTTRLCQRDRRCGRPTAPSASAWRRPCAQCHRDHGAIKNWARPRTGATEKRQISGEIGV